MTDAQLFHLAHSKTGDAFSTSRRSILEAADGRLTLTNLVTWERELTAAHGSLLALMDRVKGNPHRRWGIKLMHPHLEYNACRWLWLKRRCVVVMRERTPRNGIGQPDVFGVTAARYCIEIEIKRSVADFKADAVKPHRRDRATEWRLPLQPKEFYYCLPTELRDQIEPLIPDWAGLLVVEPDDFANWLTVVKPSPVNHESRRLSVKECARLLRTMTNYAMSLEATRMSLLSPYEYYEYWLSDFQI